MKSILNIISDLYKVPLENHNGLELVRIDHCLKLIDACEKESILILGFEGFIISGSIVCPEMDFIADYSSLENYEWNSAVHESVVSARQFFDKIRDSKNTFFSFELIAK